MTFELAFRHDTAAQLRYIIARVSGSPVHVALLFDDVCIEADGKGGVTQMSRAERLADGEWSLIPIADVNVAATRAFAERQVGKRYDWLGVLWAWWGGRPDFMQHLDKWYCSELAAAALIVGGSRRLPWSRKAPAYSPRVLFDTLTLRSVFR